MLIILHQIICCLKIILTSCLLCVQTQHFLQWSPAEEDLIMQENYLLMSSRNTCIELALTPSSAPCPGKKVIETVGSKTCPDPVQLLIGKMFPEIFSWQGWAFHLELLISDMEQIWEMSMCTWFEGLEYGYTVQLCTWNTAAKGPEHLHSDLILQIQD